MFGGADSFRHFTVLQAFGNKLDDSVFTLTGDTCPITSTCRHACLRYNRVASFTRLIPPVMPKRRNNRLKWAFTVRRAILSWLAISALSQPCKRSSTICCSRGPSRTVCSFIRFPLFSFLTCSFCLGVALGPNRRLADLTKSHSIQIATLRQKLSVTLEHHFPQALASNRSAL